MNIGTVTLDTKRLKLRRTSNGQSKDCAIYHIFK